MKKHLLLSTLLAFTISLPFSSAQEIIPASGGNATGSGGSSVSYSIGQVFYYIHTGEGGTLADRAPASIGQTPIQVAHPRSCLRFLQQ